jgi:hypothetical protein
MVVQIDDFPTPQAMLGMRRRMWDGGLLLYDAPIRLWFSGRALEQASMLLSFRRCAFLV